MRPGYYDSDPDFGAPRFVPWEFVAPHEETAGINHDQTLARLNERGGLCPSELVAVLEDRDWHPMQDQEAADRLNELLAAWQSSRKP